jgi:hypothetical protein
MADALQTYAFQFRGGLITNLPPLQQGVEAPGSAHILKNFEPSVEGGYKRIAGYTKYDSTMVPAYGTPVVHGASQTGNTLVIADIFATPVAGNTFTIAGVTGTYTINTVSYDSTNKRATLSLNSSLASSPANAANITFTNISGLINGVSVWEDGILSLRNNNLYKSSGTGWTKINVPSYGTVLVNGASQTGSSLIIDGLTGIPSAGDTFKIAGVDKVYTVTADATVTSGGATLSINPALASSPADNAAITWLTSSFSGGTKLRTSKYRISNVAKIVGVDGSNYPFSWDGTTYTSLSGISDIKGASFVTWHKSQLFFAKDDKLIFTAPLTDNDFSAANGAGIISVGGVITGMIVFRESLIVFTDRTISQLVGNTLSDFQLQPITRKVGCIASDTIQEMGGDVLFLGPDGLRLIGATDKIGDFSLGLVSKQIQKEITDLISSNTSFSSVIIKSKSQYRIFGYNSATTTANALGILGTQMTASNTSDIAWGQLVGIKAYVADSDYKNQSETIIFAHTDGYIYQMESGNSFDGSNIQATFMTPYVHINDPRIRKTFYKVYLYTDTYGGVQATLNLKLDFDDPEVIQPNSVPLGSNSNLTSIFGASTVKYGVSRFGTKVKKLLKSQVVGSGFSVALQFTYDDHNPSFSLDSATLEFSTHDRR